MTQNGWMILIVLMFTLVRVAPAETDTLKTIHASGKFTMGDLDSKSDAKEIALINAKRAALEQAGTYVSSLTEVKNYRLSKDEISSLTAGMVAVKILDEKWSMEGESPTVTVSIEATVNTESLNAHIQALKEDTQIVQNYIELQSQVDALKGELASLKAAKESDDAETPATSESVDGNLDKQKETVGKLIALDHLIDADQHINQGETDAAKEAIERSIARQPDNYKALLVRSQIYIKQRRYSQAMDDVNAALQIEPNAFQANALKGDLYLKLDQPQRAVSFLNRALSLNSTCGRCYLARGKAYLKLKHFKSAVKDLNTACKLGNQQGCNTLARLKEDQSTFKRNSRSRNRRPHHRIR